MKTKALSAVMILVGLVSFAHAGASKDLPSQVAQPVAFVPEPSYSFPAVLEGEKVTHSFSIKNTGTAPLMITRVDTSCGCTTADYTKVISPGREGSVTLILKTRGFSGRSVEKTATVFTNSPITMKILLHMTGYIDRVVSIIPNRVELFGAPGETVRSVVEVIPSKRHPLRLIGTPAGNENRFKCHLEKRNETYLLTVENVLKTEGNYVDQIVLKTDSPEHPEIAIRVVGRIQKSAK